MTAPEILPPELPDRVAFAERIRGHWEAARDGIFEAGRALCEAKDALPHGAFGAMIAEDLPFGDRMARILMKIAANEWLANRKHVSVLPQSVGALYELTRMSDRALDEAFARGRIRPDMDRADAVRLVQGERHAGRLEKVERLAAEGCAALDAFAGSRRWAVIYADPPWSHETRSDKGQSRSPGRHYPTMTLEEIAALPVGAVAAEDAALFLWTTANRVHFALRILEGWGFEYKSQIVWIKGRPDEQPQPGTGHWVRDCHEVLIIATRGEVPCPLPGDQAPSAIAIPKGRHSEKPERFRDIVDGYFPGVRKLELFRRGDAPEGWDVWGNEAVTGEGAA